MIKIDKNNTLIDLTDLLVMKKVFASEFNVFSQHSIEFIFKANDTEDGLRTYVHEYPSKESMEQWYSIITKKLQEGVK